MSNLFDMEIVGRKVKRGIIVICLLLFHFPAWAQSTIAEVYLNRAWVDGSVLGIRAYFRAGVSSLTFRKKHMFAQFTGIPQRRTNVYHFAGHSHF